MDLQRLKARSRIIQLIRRFFDERGYLEMHTPRLVGLPGQEPHLEPFWTEVQAENMEHRAMSIEHQAMSIEHQAMSIEHQAMSIEHQADAQCPMPNALPLHPAALITSPEYMMKRLLAAGLDKIYDLGPCFRNGEPWDGTHDPEFLLLEWYRRDADLQSLMDETEEMVKWIMEQSGVALSSTYAAFRRLTVEDAWREYAGIELAPLLDDREAMAAVCREHGQTVVGTDTWDDLYFKIFLSDIEPKISPSSPAMPTLRSASRQPFNKRLVGTSYQLPATFLYRYPASMAALARRSQDDPRWADRVELYIGGLELANGFAELSDPDEQRRRFLEEQEQRRKMGKKTWPIDEKLLAALPQMGNAVGIAFGVDRFVMLLTGATSINDVIPSSARERFGADISSPL